MMDASCVVHALCIVGITVQVVCVYVRLIYLYCQMNHNDGDVPDSRVEEGFGKLFTVCVPGIDQLTESGCIEQLVILSVDCDAHDDDAKKGGKSPAVRGTVLR